MSELTARQEEYLDALPQPSYQAWADAVGASESSAEEMRRRLNDENDEIAIEKVDGEWLNTFGDADDPEREDLNERETYIYRSLPKSAAALADDLGIEEIVVDAHLQSIADKGWPWKTTARGTTSPSITTRCGLRNTRRRSRGRQTSGGSVDTTSWSTRTTGSQHPARGTSTLTGARTGSPT